MRAPAKAAVVLAAVLAVCGALIVPWWLHGAFLPPWVTWSSMQQTCDLNDDGADEELVLAGKRLSILGDDGARYHSPDDWFVSDAFVADMTHDDAPEVVIIAWKRGSFGTGKPFWIERDDPGFSQHVFLFDYAAGELKPVWMSSALSFEARAARMDERARLHLRDALGEETVWKWGSWGLVLDEGDDAEGAVEPARPADAGSSAYVKRPTSAGGQARDAAPEVDSGKASLTLLAIGDVIAHESIIDDARVGGATAQEPGTAGGASAQEPGAVDGASTAGAAGDVSAADAADATETGAQNLRQFDFTPLFSPVKEEIRGYDLAVAIQETPFVNDPARYAGYPRFGTPCALGDALVDAGFDIVAAATNHADDQGETGILDTTSFWEGRHADVTLLGMHGEPADAAATDYVERNGIRLALFDYTFALNGHTLEDERAYQVDVLGEERLTERVSAAEGSCDATVCFLHIGDEYSLEPTQAQRALCEQLVAAGADAVICSHSHIAQPVEAIRAENGNEGIVYWSLGNFISNQVDPATVLGGAASLTIVKDDAGTRIDSYELVPTVCHFEQGATQAYWLADYTDELAARHYLNGHFGANAAAPAVTLEGLLEQYRMLNKT